MQTVTNDLRNGPLAYLASPFTLFELGLGMAFADISTIAGRLVQAGCKLICPVTHSYPMGVYAELNLLDLSIWNPLNDELMARCDVLIVAQMDGWDRSEGIKREVAYFERVRKPIFDLDPVSLQLTRRKSEKPPRQRADGWTDEQIAADRAEWLGDALNKAGHCHRLAHSKSPSEQGGASV